ncbi:MAG TPA: PaaI family thioesterase [Acidimicrobiales bacterium]
MVTAPEYGEFALKRFLGMELGEVEPGRARARIAVSDQHLNPNGVVHGAVLFAMVDTAMGGATMSVLPEGQFCASVDVQLRFVRPASEGVLVADVSVLKQGRGIVHLDGRVHDADERLIATASGTFAVIAP